MHYEYQFANSLLGYDIAYVGPRVIKVACFLYPTGPQTDEGGKLFLLKRKHCIPTLDMMFTFLTLMEG